MVRCIPRLDRSMDFSIVIPYRPSGQHRQRSADWNYARWKAWFPDADIVFADSGHAQFNRAASRNAGVEKANHETILFADADTFAPKKFWIDVAVRAQIEKSYSWILPYAVYINANALWSEAILEEDSETFEVLQEPAEDLYDHRLTDSISGIFTTTKSAWNEINGEDERFNGWGMEDRARELALDTLCGPHERVLNTFVVHLYHPAPEENCFGQPEIENNRRLHGRYLRASGDKEAMRSLCNEH